MQGQILIEWPRQLWGTEYMLFSRNTTYDKYGNTRLRRTTAQQVSLSMVLTVHKNDYKHSKEAFVSGMTGSTVAHVNMIALVALVCRHPLVLPTTFAHDRLQGLYCATLRHPLTLATTEIPSLPFGMAAPRYPSSPLNDPFRSSPRHAIRRLASSHRVHMLSFPAIPVRYTATFWWRCFSPFITRVASRTGFIP